jgi:oxaloacetate decarboxylase alpha subunit
VKTVARTVRFVDTTLRDGQQSLWALRMRTGTMLPALEDLDLAGFDAIEFTVPNAQFARMSRDMDEDLWTWLREGTGMAQRTSLRLHGSVGSYFAKVPDCVQALFLDKLVRLGITVVRTSDPWNDFHALKPQVDFFHRHGFKVIVNIVYSASPRHTTEYFRERIRQAVALNPYRLCLKDVGGIMTPDVCAELVPLILAEAGDIPVEFHAHCNSGLGSFCTLLAARLGIDFVHTAIPPLSDGSSLPSVFDIVENLRDEGISADIDLDRISRVREHFTFAAESEGLPVGRRLEYSSRLYRHQVPGGMISNLQFQLEQVGAGDRLQETLDEAARVRRDLGYPIMVTPLSQIVGVQAAMNVITGERYGTVTDEIVEYALGRRGAEAVQVMDADLRASILARRRARDIAERDDTVQSEVTLEEVRQRYGGDISDEELITRVYANIVGGHLPHTDESELSRSYAEYRDRRDPTAALVEAFSKADGLKNMHFRRGDIDIAVRR